MTTILEATPLSEYDPEIGRWLWAMEEVRRRTVRLVADVDPWTLDWEGPDRRENSIGSLLYHIALVELSWLHMDVLEQDVPEALKQAFPHEMATGGRVTPVLGVPLVEHVDRLDRSRSAFLDSFRELALEEWDRLRAPADSGYQVTPAWVVFHLVEHEAIHAGQISSLKARAARARA